MYFLKKSSLFFICITLFNVLGILQAEVIKSTQQPLILDNNPYDIKWFKGIYYAWEIKNLAHMNNINLQDAFTIQNTLGEKELYLTSLTKLIMHINQAFQNNPLYKNFNTSNSLSYNLFNFLSYIYTLQQTSPEDVDDLLKNEFNLYEIVSIKRLAEDNLSSDISKTKHTIVKYNINDSKIEELSNEYEGLNIQDLVFSKKEHDDNNIYISCLKKETSLSLIDKITECNKLYSKDNKENLLIGIRKCYLGYIYQIKELNTHDINQTITNLHIKCAPIVNSYLQNSSNTNFVQKYLIYLLGSYLKKVKQN